MWDSFRSGYLGAYAMATNVFRAPFGAGWDFGAIRAASFNGNTSVLGVAAAAAPVLLAGPAIYSGINNLRAGRYGRGLLQLALGAGLTAGVIYSGYAASRYARGLQPGANVQAGANAQAPAAEVGRNIPPAPEIPPAPNVPPAPNIPPGPKIPPGPNVPPASPVPPASAVPPASPVPPAPNIPPGPKIPPAPQIPPASPVTPAGHDALYDTRMSTPEDVQPKRISPRHFLGALGYVPLTVEDTMKR